MVEILVQFSVFLHQNWAENKINEKKKKKNLKIKK